MSNSERMMAYRQGKWREQHNEWCEMRQSRGLPPMFGVDRWGAFTYMAQLILDDLESFYMCTLLVDKLFYSLLIPFLNCCHHSLFDLCFTTCFIKNYKP
jgi:hypothetical protein